MVGAIQSSRFFIDKKKDLKQNGNQELDNKNQNKISDDKKQIDEMIFVQIIDQQNKCMIKGIIDRNRVNNKLIKENFQTFSKILKQNTVFYFEGDIGLGKNNEVSIYIRDFLILKIQPQFLIALQWLYICQKFQFSDEIASTALQVSQIELEEIKQIGGEQIKNNKFENGGKQQNQLKMKLIQITRALQNLPIQKIKMRPPVFPLELFKKIEDYKNKYQELGQQIEEIQIQSDQHNQESKFKLKQLIINYPEEITEERLQYLKQKKQPQIQWFLQQLYIVLENIKAKKLKFGENSGKIKIIDIGGGRGDLSINIANQFKELVEVIVVDINEISVKAGQKQAEQKEIKNIQFKHIGIEELTIKIKEQDEIFKELDLVVGLHTCGGLCEAILNFCALLKLPFFVCTCCFSSLFHLIPEQFYTESVFLEKNDRKYLGRFAESHEGYNVAEQCMHIINYCRIKNFQNLMALKIGQYDYSFKFQILRFPKQFSLKNFVLKAVYEE
ncbi:hypothetical protein PPERSA_04645 [Pseudocohnilembus persalinus]|uniref:Methyltransferase domain-containing protein n=1 Tax=Pseudocohnilembus persalinus TaxID=266149 RepID=A0A0V0QP55_PSEPJ|nr:hypothetical protein PPERSA_04645 [Pseudocohnilembus persalinus]|eukprot:KRX03850.1 hypothetical protein PPERSA_04645 [Pseudocohnilembus persalinus]